MLDLELTDKFAKDPRDLYCCGIGMVEAFSVNSFSTSLSLRYHEVNDAPDGSIFVIAKAPAHWFNPEVPGMWTVSDLAGCSHVLQLG